MSWLQRLICRLRGHAWAPICILRDDDGQYEQRICYRCARVELWCGGSREGWGGLA